MTDNPLSTVKVVRESKLTARDWHAMAREKGLPEHTKAWAKKALELGETLLPEGMTVRFKKDKTKEYVRYDPSRGVYP